MIESLVEVASAKDVPLIIDNAYGMPFPNIVFSDVKPMWNEDMILCMSMSKLGLPGVRTGVVVASEEIVEALAGMNSVLSLAVPTVGAVAVEPVLGGLRARLAEPLLVRRRQRGHQSA